MIATTRVSIKNVARLYGAVAPRTVAGKTVESIVRSAFLIDETGAIAATWYKVNPAPMGPPRPCG